VGAWGISLPIPKKYGRLLIKGKAKTKNRMPQRTLIREREIIRIRTGTRAIWKDFTRGTYL
jgi:hypothetical protein